MWRAADNRKEATFCVLGIWAELDRDGGGAGEGAGDGGAEVVICNIVIITIIRAAETQGRGAIINFHPVGARTNTKINIQTVEGEGDCFVIGWLQHPSLQ